MVQKLIKQKGFTLIELLVVIAIIGLLATIVLVSFTDIRTQGKDAAIKANINQMRLAAEIAYNLDGDYSGVTGREDYSAALAAVEDAAGESATVNIDGDGESYCFQIALPGGSDWCVDSLGFVGEASGCDVVNYDCAAE